MGSVSSRLDVPLGRKAYPTDFWKDPDTVIFILLACLLYTLLILLFISILVACFEKRARIRAERALERNNLRRENLGGA
jgi:hypothetical protein